MERFDHILQVFKDAFSTVTAPLEIVVLALSLYALLRFLRGSGTAGLAGIRPVTSDGFVRPLLAVDRADVELYLRERAIPWREDASNASLAFARNRIRHELLPQLQRDWNPALAETLAHTADWAFEEEAWWTAEIERLAAIHLQIKPRKRQRT